MLYLVSFSLAQVFGPFLHSDMSRFNIGLNRINHFTLIVNQSSQIFENGIDVQDIRLKKTNNQLKEMCVSKQTADIPLVDE